MKGATAKKGPPAGVAKVLKRLPDLEEMMAERGLAVDHSRVHCWVVKLPPLFEKGGVDFETMSRQFDRDIAAKERRERLW
jgi:transposase-like protein